MTRIDPTKILVGGDREAAKRFLKPARSQMEILKNQMSFQNLSQGIRRVWLNEDVYIECRKIFHYQECKVWVRPVPVVGAEEPTVRYFLVVFSTWTGSEAVIWDLVSDTVFMGINPETEANYTLAELQTSFEDAGLPSFVEAILPAEDTHTWDSSHPSHVHDAPLMLPDYVIGWYGDFGWYDVDAWIMSFHDPAWLYNYYMNFWPGNIKWILEYVDESPLPYPSKKVLSTTAPDDEQDEKASYINGFYGVLNSDLIPEDPDPHPIVVDFETLTGRTWPSGFFEVGRYYQFWHPFFWYSFKDTPGYLDTFNIEGRGILLQDTWADGEWTGSGSSIDLDKPSYTRFTSGMATITETVESVPLEDPQVLLFEYVSVCHKFVDTYGNGMCDTDLCDFDEYFRIYEHGKIPLSGMVKQILDLTNAERVAQGTHELVFNSVLSESAQRHAEDQAALVAASGMEGITDGHIGTDGSTPAERIFDAGYYKWIEDDVENIKNETAVWATKVSENVAWTWDPSPAERAIQLWRSSTQGHWENMIDEDLVELGIGIAGLPNGGYCFVQNFGKVDHRYPGFSPFDPENLKNYVDLQFIFDPAQVNARLPKMYLIGPVELNDDEFYRLTGRKQGEEE